MSQVSFWFVFLGGGVVGCVLGFGLCLFYLVDPHRLTDSQRVVDDLAAKRTPQGPYWQRERR